MNGFGKRAASISRPVVRWAAALFLACCCSAWAGETTHPGSEELELQVSDCAGCHDSQIEAFLRGPHGAAEIVSAAAATVTAAAPGCASCHGDAQAHMDEGGEGPIFGFGDDDLPSLKSSRCLDCHAGTHPRFFATRHASAGLDCTSCHSIHEGGGEALLKSSGVALAGFREDLPSASCAECHSEVFAEFSFNERHRLEEGILDCASCHDPHEPQARLALGGFKQDQCTSCHADKEGPFIFEHGGQRVEGCVACHDPHGAPNRHMLTFQSVADLCYSCHGVVPGFHTRFTAETQCTNCHSTIHGSNFDPYFLK